MDPEHDRLVVVARDDTKQVYELWSLALESMEWTFLGQLPGIPLSGLHMILDAARSRLIIISDPVYSGPSLRVFTSPLSDPIGIAEVIPSGVAPVPRGYVVWDDPAAARSYLLSQGGAASLMVLERGDELA